MFLVYSTAIFLVFVFNEIFFLYHTRLISSFNVVTVMAFHKETQDD